MLHSFDGSRELAAARWHEVSSRTNVRSSAAAVTPAKVVPAGGGSVATRAPVDVAPTVAA